MESGRILDRMIGPTISKSLVNWKRLINERTIIILTIMFLVGIAGMLWNLSRLSSNLIESTALQDAARYSKALAEFRGLYTSEVVARVEDHNIAVTHDYLTKEAAIPLPATLSMELGQRISTQGVLVRLYSDYPFPWRDTGGPQDDFEKEALRDLRERPDEPFVRFEDVEGRPSLRYATADIMRPSCVSCHNSHPDSPKTNWQEGDVRGVLEVIRPLDNVVEHTRGDLRSILGATIVMTIFGVAGLVIALRGMRQSSQALQQRAHRLEAEITERKQAEVSLLETQQLLAEYNRTLQQRHRELGQANQEITGLSKRLKVETLRLSAELEVSNKLREELESNKQKLIDKGKEKAIESGGQQGIDDLTRQLQQLLLPTAEEVQQISGVELAGWRNGELEEDSYDLLLQQGLVQVGIGGTSFESGILMLITRGVVRTLLTGNEREQSHFLSTFNRTLDDNLQRTTSSFSLALLDYQGHERLPLSQAHEKIIVVYEGGQVTVVDSYDLGFPTTERDESAASVPVLAPVKGIVLYITNIAEAQKMDAKDEQLEQLREVVSHHWQESAKAITAAVIEQVRSSTGQKIDQDLTLLVLKQK